MVPAALTLEDRYAQACATPSDIYEHLPTLVALVEKHRAGPGLVIELGTRTGVSTVAFLHALAGSGGHLWSVDLDPPPDLGKQKHWTFIQGDDCSPEVFAQMPRMVDVVFVDTDHDYAHTLRELELYRWLVRPGGIMLFHDTQLAHPAGIPPQPPFPVRRALDTFCRAEGYEWVDDPKCFGLGLVQVW